MSQLPDFTFDGKCRACTANMHRDDFIPCSPACYQHALGVMAEITHYNTIDKVNRAVDVIADAGYARPGTRSTTEASAVAISTVGGLSGLQRESLHMNVLGIIADEMKDVL